MTTHATESQRLESLRRDLEALEQHTADQAVASRDANLEAQNAALAARRREAEERISTVIANAVNYARQLQALAEPYRNLVDRFSAADPSIRRALAPLLDLTNVRNRDAFDCLSKLVAEGEVDAVMSGKLFGPDFIERIELRAKSIQTRTHQLLYPESHQRGIAAWNALPEADADSGEDE